MSNKDTIFKTYKNWDMSNAKKAIPIPLFKECNKPTPILKNPIKYLLKRNKIMRKSLLLFLAIIGLSACNKIPENVAGVDLKQVGELGANLLETNIKAQCENGFNQLRDDDDDDDGDGGAVLNAVLTPEQRQAVCGCAFDQIKQTASASELQKLSDGGTQAIKILF